MGIGTIGIGGANVVFKRKFRWTFEIRGKGGCDFSIPPLFLKTAARPSITIEDIELNFLNDRTWIPGKAAWEPITVTYLDNNQNGTVDLLKWLANVFDFTNPTGKTMSSRREDYCGEATIIMWDGCGNPMETWTLYDAWPQAINFGDLDYGSSDIAEIELTLRYSQVKYESSCGAKLTKDSLCACAGCE